MGQQTVEIDRDLEELIPGFMENRAKDIVLLKEAVTKEDFEGIRTIGHSMKGFGSGYGFDFISEVGKVMEQAAKDGDLRQIQTCIDQLEAYIQKVIVEFI